MSVTPVCVQEQGAEGRWQKADLLLEFGEWLYGQNQPLQATQHHLHRAIDLLLQLDPEPAQETGTPSTNLYHTCSTVRGKIFTLCYWLNALFIAHIHRCCFMVGRSLTLVSTAL